MNTQTPQSLDEIFEEGRISEMEKLNNWLNARYPNFSGEKLLVVKKYFLQENANAFCDEFNQGSRYKDAFCEVNLELTLKKELYSDKSITEMMKAIKEEFLICKGLTGNRLQLFEEFFAAGSEKISFDFGRKKAWTDFGLIPNSTNEKDPQDILFRCLITDESFLEFFYEKWDGNYINGISFDDFKKHLKGDTLPNKINWCGKLYELVRFMDMLHFCFNPRMYKDTSALFKPISEHFLFNNKSLNPNSWDRTRNNYNKITGMHDEVFKKIENIISALKKIQK